MLALPAQPISPQAYIEEWLPQAFAAVVPFPGTEQLSAKLGILLEGASGGEWVVEIEHGEVRITRGSREETAFSYIQRVEDWEGAIWHQRGGAIGTAFSRFFRPGAEVPEGPVGALVGAPDPRAYEMLERLDGYLRIVVTDSEQADWSVGVRLGPGLVPAIPTCSLWVSSEDAESLSRGDTDPMQALLSGKLVVEGDMTLMLQAQAVVQQAAMMKKAISP